MREIPGTKDDYDRIYGWASIYARGHWPALRNKCMTHCGNPLYRFHRIPMPSHRYLGEAIPGGVRLVNGIFRDVEELYPNFSPPIELINISKHGTGDPKLVYER